MIVSVQHAINKAIYRQRQHKLGRCWLVSQTKTGALQQCQIKPSMRWQSREIIMPHQALKAYSKLLLITITTVTWCMLIYKIESSSSVIQNQQSLGSDVKRAVIKMWLWQPFESVVLRIVAGNVFNTIGPETENAHSPSLVGVLGMTNMILVISSTGSKQ